MATFKHPFQTDPGKPPELQPPAPFTEGLLEVYTGDGVGKTSVALGLILRAVGHGLRVYCALFRRNALDAQVAAAVRYLPGVTLVECNVLSAGAAGVLDQDKAVANSALDDARAALTSGEYNVIILDDVNVAVTEGLLTAAQLLELNEARPANVELVCNGRGATQEVMDAAELVTEVAVPHHARAEQVTSPQPGHGLLTVITGDGKGKSTDAFGVILTAVAHGQRVYCGLFMKGAGEYGEFIASHYLPGVTLERYGTDRLVDFKNLTPEDLAEAAAALDSARRAMLSGQYDLIILDEINVAERWKLLPTERVLDFLAARPANVTVVLTGRYANPRIIEMADLATEMKQIRHPYEQGILSRQGIDY